MEMLVTALTLIAIIALGHLVKRIGWLQASDFRPLSIIALRITLPCALVTSFDSFEIGPQLFAIPYVGAFLGPEAIVVASMFDIGNALAGAGIAYAWGLGLASGRPASLGRFVRTVFSSPVFLTYLALVVMGLARVRLPDPVLQFTATVGAANTFVAMFMIGVGLELVLDRRAYGNALRFLATRWAVMAVAAAVLWFVLPFGPAEKAILLALLCAPMAAMTSGFTAEAGLDVRVSTFMTTMSVLVAIVAMPVVLSLL
ncbi:hypothetical protein PCC79_14605 [Propioniciclava soli]|uniref:AEC family transporter n=1 Tax=Propioniciclava soli TaxID=2775081 RepID=A0ABZ3C648_9ACTN